MMSVLSVGDIARLAEGIAAKVLKKKVDGVIGVTKDAEGWRVLVEVVERETPTTISDTLGTYEVMLDGKGTLMGYERRGMRSRVPIETVG